VAREHLSTTAARGQLVCAAACNDDRHTYFDTSSARTLAQRDRIGERPRAHRRTRRLERGCGGRSEAHSGARVQSRHRDGSAPARVRGTGHETWPLAKHLDGAEYRAVDWCRA